MVMVAKAQTVVYSENFNGPTHTWSLNTTDASSSVAPNSDAGLKNYWIVNMGGKVVRTISLVNDKTANVSDLASGIYLVKVNTKTSANVFKIVKED